MAEFDFLTIGIDGGATEAKAHQVIIKGTKEKPLFEIGKINASKKYPVIPNFKSVEIKQQLEERNSGKVNLTEDEIKQGENIVKAFYEVIIEIVKKTKAKKVLIGIGMPGLKTDDKRGINCMANGPRQPFFLEKLEAKLAAAKIELVAPIPRLGSDADYCGIGEQYAADGMFKDVENAYYMGGGTGIADAMKLKKSLVPFDMTKEWMMKAWQIPSAFGVTFEKLGSAKSMNEFFKKYVGVVSKKEEEKGIYPEAEALKGDPLASFTLSVTASVLAELFFERINTLKNGRQELAYRGEAYLKLKTDHPYKGMVFDRLILGQRMGKLYEDKKFAKYFKKVLDSYLSAYIVKSKDKKLISHYLDANKNMKKNIIVASKLREAPAIGAAIDAYNAIFNKQ